MATCAWRRISCGIKALSSGTMPPVSTISNAGRAIRLSRRCGHGDARFVGDDGAARAGQPVEERGLAHVGAADDDERWKQFCHKFLSRAHNGRYGVLRNLPM